jgi:hypothetical protein
MAVIVEIADAVVAELNDTEFSQTFEAERSYLPRFDLAEMKELHVTVVPNGVTILPGNRAHNQHDYQVDVAVQKKVATDEELDALMGVVGEIADHFRLKRLASFPSAVWAKTENEPIYAPDHLEQLHQFTSVLTMTFRVMR